MIYFCADDYGISDDANNRIENCLENGILNKISILPNGEIADFNKRLSGKDVTLSLHINLVEGRPLSNPDEVDLLVSEDGTFKYSFIGLLALSLSPKRKAFEKQIYKEIQRQIRFWKETIGEAQAVSLDSHQHTHMIPLVFKTLMRVIKDEQLNVEYLRVPDEPLLPYLCTPSLYLEYHPVGLVKQWLLKALAFMNRRALKKSKIKFAYFMGIMFSGEMNEARINKLLPHYIRLARKHNKDIELGFHPGNIKDKGKILDGIRQDFKKFYFSDWRNVEYDTLMNFKIDVKEGPQNALY